MLVQHNSGRAQRRPDPLAIEMRASGEFVEFATPADAYAAWQTLRSASLYIWYDGRVVGTETWLSQDIAWGK